MPHIGILSLVSLAICDCPTDGDSTPHSSRCVPTESIVTLHKNFFSNIATNGYGGAVYCPTVVATECCFRSCTVTGTNWAGAIYITSSVDPSSCSCLVGDSCSGYSVGFLVSEAVSSFAELQFFNCLARGGSIGASLYYESSSTSTSNFTSCHASLQCGAIRILSGSSTISDCFFADCIDGSSSSTGGGALWSYAGRLAVTLSIFLDCAKGPGICQQAARQGFERCAFERSEFRPPSTTSLKPNVSKSLFSGAISSQIVDLGGNQAQTTASSGVKEPVVVIAEACDYFERVLIIDTSSAALCLSTGAASMGVSRTGSVRSIEAAHMGSAAPMESSDGAPSLIVARASSVLLKPSMVAVTRGVAGGTASLNLPFDSRMSFVVVTGPRPPYKLGKIIVGLFLTLLLM